MKTRLKKNENSLRELWDNMKHNNIHILGMPEKEEMDQEIKSLFDEIRTENFPNLVREKGTVSESTESQWRSTQRCDTETHQN